MPAAKQCPQCAVPMHPFWQRQPAGGARVPIDSCPQCGGLWFDTGNLEALLGRSLRFDALEGTTTRRCPFCTLSLTPRFLESSIPVEQCSTCTGVFLDHGELTELGGEEAPAPAAVEAAKAASPDTGFTCLSCGGHFPFSEGRALKSGLGCAACVKDPSPLALQERERMVIGASIPPPGSSRPLGFGFLPDLLQIIRRLR